MVRKFNSIKNNKRKAMTLAALVVTMGVTIILLGMFVPILTQGLVNIASGKSFDGSVDLSKRNGYFMCYYNSAGQLTQSRADVAANGRDVNVVTEAAPADGCQFEIPTWPDSFRVTLVGGGGVGATPNFEVFDSVYEPTDDDTCLNSFDITADNSVEGQISYFFDNSVETDCLMSSFISSTMICLDNRRGAELTYQQTADADGAADTNYELSVNNDTKTMVYTVGIENDTIDKGIRNCRLADGSYCTSGMQHTFVRNLPVACAKPRLFLTRVRSLVDLGNITLSRMKSGIRVNVAQGGQAGQKVERVVPFFEETQRDTGVMVIPRESIGVGGVNGVNDGKGGSTTLTISEHTVLTAVGGEKGGFEQEELFAINDNNFISGQSFAGGNGLIDNFVPQVLRITDFRRGLGASDISTPAVTATYPGSGGGGGAIQLATYNNAMVRSGNACVQSRVRLNVSGDANDYELDCSPNLNLADFNNINNFMPRGAGFSGANGAAGAIVIAW